MKDLKSRLFLMIGLSASAVFFALAAPALIDKWEIKTAGLKIPVGWEPFAYDSKDQFDPFLLLRRVK